MYKIFLREYEIIQTNGKKYVQIAGFLFLGIDCVVDGCRYRKEVSIAEVSGQGRR